MQIEPYSYPQVPGPAQPQPLSLSYYSSPYEQQDDFSLRHLLGILRRRILVIAGVTVAVTGAIWAWTLTRPPIYQSGFQVLVEPITNLNKSPEVLLFGSQSNFDYATQIEVLRSPELLQRTVTNLQRLYPGIGYGEIAGSLAITQVLDPDGRPTKILMVNYRSQDPQRVKNILDQLAKDYVQYSIDLRQTSLQQGVQFVEERLPELRRRVNQLQSELQRFRQRYTLIDPDGRGAQLSGFLADIERSQQQTTKELDEKQALYTTLQRQVGISQPDVAIQASALNSSGRYQALLTQIQEIETKIASESARFQAGSPNIEALQDRRKMLLPLLNLEAQKILGTSAAPGVNGQMAGISVDLNNQLVSTANEIKVLQVRQQALQNAQQQFEKEFKLVPQLSRQFTDLQRELRIATDSLNRFLTTRENLQLEAAQKALPWQLLTTPFLPGAPIAPNVPRNMAVGLIAGLLLGVGAALLAEKLDNVFHSASDLKDITRLPLLGVIPYRKDMRELAPTEAPQLPQPTTSSLDLSEVVHPATRLDEEQEEDEAFVPAARTSSPFLDAFRSLHTNIRFLSSDEPIRSLVVGSAVPADGKSTVALNLARAAAAMGQRVLLVDADLRRPQIHAIADLPNVQGLSNIITTDRDFREVLQSSPLDENLSILTAGQIPPDPTKLLSSNKMKNLTEQFRAAFDLVIYDTPPLLGLADSSLLATHTDGIVLVVGLGRTDRSALMQALDGLRISSSTVLGMVANGVKGYTTGDYYHAYYSRYYAQADQNT